MTKILTRDLSWPQNVTEVWWWRKGRQTDVVALSSGFWGSINHVFENFEIFSRKSFKRTFFSLTETSENPSVFSQSKFSRKQVSSEAFPLFEIFCLKFTVFVKNFKINFFFDEKIKNEPKCQITNVSAYICLPRLHS